MSNVPKSKRSLSELEFFKTALRLRVQITKWLLRDFGLKPRPRSIEHIAKRHQMREDDKEALTAILDKYQLGDRLLDTFPDWWIAERRRVIDRVTHTILAEIRSANAIYPTCVEECMERRIHQDRAISAVDVLVGELHFMIEILGGTEVQISKFEPWIELCEHEYKLLKGWRKADNKFLARLGKKKGTT